MVDTLQTVALITDETSDAKTHLLQGALEKFRYWCLIGKQFYLINVRDGKQKQMSFRITSLET